jgi:hypothetical protein
LAYVDESYNAERHWVVALLIHHLRVNPTQAALRLLVENAADEHGISDTAELHGYDLFHGSQQFTPLSGKPRARIGLFRSVFETLVAADCWIILRGVNKTGLRRRYGRDHEHPHRITMTYLIESIDEFCKSARSGDDYALLVADEHHETQSELLRDLVIYQEHRTWGWRSKRIERVVDTIHFVNSVTNPLVQGADMVNFMWLRSAHTGGDPRSAAAVERLMGIIEPRIHYTRCWHP